LAFRLVVARGNHQGSLFIAVQPEVFLGRDNGNDVILSDVGVSGRHARFLEREGRFFVADCGTPNGTLVNGERVAGEHELKAGDAVAVGTAVVQFAGEIEGSRKKLVPVGVAGSPLAPTGGRAAIAREADTERTTPVGQPLREREEKTEEAGRPLTKEEIAEAMATGGGGAPAATMMDAEDAPPGGTVNDLAPVLDAPPGATIRSLPPVESVHPERSADEVRAESKGQVPDRSAADGYAGVSGAEASSGTAPFDKLRVNGLSERAPITARELPIPEGRRETKDGPTDPRIALTMLAPDLPAEAQLLTEAASVLVPAAQALQRAPDVSNVSTQVKRDPPAAIPDAFAPLPGGAAPAPTTAERPSAKTTDDPTAPRGVPLGVESAADRARRRREAQATLGGQLAFLWSELSVRARLTLILALGVVGAVLGVGLIQVFRPPPTRELPPEPAVLSPTPITFSFGLGDVDYEHSDFKELRFDVAAPTAAAVLVHYQAQDISPDEVSISVNGTEVGFVPADVGLPDRELEALLSQFAIKRNASNVVVFDNVKNPPGHERWRISHLWMELIPVPETGKEAALAGARAALERGATSEKQHESGDDMLFRAWRAYREGWLSLLALRDEERGPLFSELKRRCDSVRFALDTQCGTLMLDAKKQMELKNPDAAREILEGVPRFFPTKDHPCHALAEEKLAEYEL
jgi:hypothetical protein